MVRELNIKTASGRVVSPENVLETANAVFQASPSKAPLNQDVEALADQYYGDPEQRVTIWNRIEQRKLSGNSAPFRKNIVQYIRKHPEWELYMGQDKEGYVPGSNMMPLPPQRPPSSRHQSPTAPRERESRRVAVQQQRERERREAAMHTSPRLYGRRSPNQSPRGASARATPRASGMKMELADEEIPPLYLTYCHATGRESEAPLLLSDTTQPTVVPSCEEVATQRAREMESRREKLAESRRHRPDDHGNDNGTEVAASADVAPAVEADSWEQRWAAAQASLASAKLKQIETQAVERKKRELKRKADEDTRQASLIDASSARIGSFKRLRLRKAAVVEAGGGKEA